VRKRERKPLSLQSTLDRASERERVRLLLPFYRQEIFENRYTKEKLRKEEEGKQKKNPQLNFEALHSTLQCAHFPLPQKAQICSLRNANDPPSSSPRQFLSNELFTDVGKGREDAKKRSLLALTGSFSKSLNILLH